MNPYILYSASLSVLQWADELDIIDFDGSMYGDTYVEDRWVRRINDERRLETLYWMADRNFDIFRQSDVAGSALKRGDIDILRWLGQFEPPLDQPHDISAIMTDFCYNRTDYNRNCYCSQLCLRQVFA